MKNTNNTINNRFDFNKINTLLENKKFALFIVAYNAEKHIEKTISRIPKELINKFAEIYLIDDFSKDKTSEAAEAAFSNLGIKNYRVMRTPFNQGYGGNQKIGYSYAIKKGYDYVIMLHGDGQYPPEFLPDIIAGFLEKDVQAVFGSRMINRFQALKGGMPMYKWIGNQILTRIENSIMGSNLSEFHSGYRAYSTKALSLIYFNLNSNDFHFDTDIIIQFLSNNLKIKEIPMPTHYGDEVCHVNGMKYFWNCLKSVIKYRLCALGIFYQPNFEIKKELKRKYKVKNSSNSLHQYVINLPWEKNDSVIDLGANDGILSEKISVKVNDVTAVDIKKPEANAGVKTIGLDLNGNFDEILGYEKFNKAIALDIIEHLYDPEKAMLKINNILKDGGKLYISTANIAFILMRFTLLLGWFNYGKRGILDKTHHRLYTISSFKRLLKNNEFTVEKVVGFGPPIADEISNKGIFAFMDKLAGYLAKTIPSVFSFNYLIIAKKNTPLQKIYNLTAKD